MRYAAPVSGVLVALASAVAAGDVVVLRSGATLDGVVQRADGRVRVEMEYGAITVDESQVSRVESRRSPLETYRERAAALAPADTAGSLRLAAWCRVQGLETCAREQYERILASEPDQAEARARLGYRRVDGAWVSADDYWRGRGFVYQDGQWMSPEAASAREESRRRAEESARRSEEASARERAAQAEREAAQARVAAVQAQAEYEREDRWRSVVVFGGGYRHCSQTVFAPLAPTVIVPARPCRGTGEPASIRPQLPQPCVGLRHRASADQAETPQARHFTASWNTPPAGWNSLPAGWGAAGDGSRAP